MNIYLPSYYIRIAVMVLMTLAGSLNMSAKPAVGKPLSARIQDNGPYMSREFKLDGPGVIKAFTLAGNIELQSIANTQKVRVELYIDRGYAFWSNTKDLDNYRITMLQRGNEVVASVERKSKETGFFSDQMTFSYKIYVPVSMSAELKTSGGHIEISGVKGDHIIKTSGGNIEAHNTSGKLAAYTAGGNIDISSSTGTIFAQTEGGNMTIDDCSGELRLKTNGGQVRAERVSGSMLAKVGGGNIKANFLDVSQGISLETKAGDIYLKVPGDSGYNVLLRGTRINLPEGAMFEGAKTADQVDGTLGNGGATINMSTEYGTVTLETDK